MNKNVASNKIAINIFNIKMQIIVKLSKFAHSKNAPNTV